MATAVALAGEVDEAVSEVLVAADFDRFLSLQDEVCETFLEVIVSQHRRRPGTRWPSGCAKSHVPSAARPRICDSQSCLQSIAQSDRVDVGSSPFDCAQPRKRLIEHRPRVGQRAMGRCSPLCDRKFRGWNQCTVRRQSPMQCCSKWRSR